MALTMADFIEKKGLGQDVDASQVNLSANDLARLSRIQNVDSRSGYSGLGIQQAQELTSELPQAADLGLVVEQNKQLAAAGGRGYAGNVHNLQGNQTPFEQLTASIAANQVPDQGGVPQEQIGLRGGDGNGGDSIGSGRDMDVAGPFSKEAFKDVALGTGMKGLLSGGLAYGIGAPLGAATKFGLSSMFGPVGALLGMGKMALGGIDDVALDTKMSDVYAGVNLTPAEREAMLQIEKTLMEQQGFGDRMGDRFGALGTIADQMKQEVGYSALAADMNPAGAYARGMERDPLTAPVARMAPTFGIDRVGWGPEGSSGNGGDSGGYGGNSTGSSAPGGEGRGPGSSAHGGHSAYGGGGGSRGATDGMGPGSDSGSGRSSSDDGSGGGMGGK